MKKRSSLLPWLVLGDVLAILAVTVIGFLDHYGELRGFRWLSTFIPALVGWFAIAPWLGVYDRDCARQPRQVWRPMLAAVLSAPLAAVLRGAWLNTPVLPIFVGVLAAMDALGFGIWRLGWAFFTRRSNLNG
jgi:hypothetical protein